MRSLAAIGDVFGISDFADKFNAAVAGLDAQVANLRQTESDLWDVQPVVQASGDDTLITQWNDSMNRVIAMNSTIDSVRAQIQTVAGWWNSVKASFGGTVSTPGVLNGLRGMGLLPAIPWSVIALVVGGTTAIAGVIYAASQVINRARQYQYSQAVIQAQRDGVPPPPNPFEGQDANTGGILDTLGSIGNAVPWLIAGGIVLMLARRKG